MSKNVEILAPAGNREAFIAAINAGADAIYMGINKFNARAMAINFTVDEYKMCIAEAHQRDVKIYLTINTLFKNSELEEALDIIGTLYKEGLDAVILQDLGLALAVHKAFPGLAMHASTQMSVYSKEQVAFLESMGFTRVVLARELTADEIEEICNSTNVELEVFVHGALCVCVSGQCNMSKLIGDRSANRGSCAQPCRRKYTLHSGNGREIISSKYILSKKDIWGLDNIKTLIDLGVTSLKIEGRNRTPQYVALATSLYKKGANGEVTENNKKELLQMFNRSGKSAGYLNGVEYSNSISLDTPKNTGLVLGKVLAQKQNFIKIKLQEKIDLHDGIEIFSKNNISTIVTCIKDEHYAISNTQKSAGEYVWLGDIKGKCETGDIVYKTSDSSLNKQIEDSYLNKLKRGKYFEIKISIKEAQSIIVEVFKNDHKLLQYTSDFIPEKSLKKELQASEVINAFSKTEDTFVKFNLNSIIIDNGLFLPISKLNELRRQVIAEIEKKYYDIKHNDKYTDINSKDIIQNMSKGIFKKIPKKESLYIYSYDNTRDYIKEYYAKYGKNIEQIYIEAKDFVTSSQDIFAKYKSLEIFFVIPNVTLHAMNTYITNNLEKLIKDGVTGVLIGSLQYVGLIQELKEKYKIIVGADYTLNICNNITAAYLQNSIFDFITLSFELEENELGEMTKNYSVELVENLACAMTSRYCILGSFIGDKEKGICSKPCKKGNYYITDEFGKRYDIVCNNIDCIMKLIRNKDRYNDKIREDANIRHVWLS